MTNHRPKQVLTHTIDLTAADMNILHGACNMLYRLFMMSENKDNQRKINNIHDELDELIDYLENCANDFLHDDEEIKGMLVEMMEDDGRFKED